MILAAVFALAYVIGAIPFGVIVARAKGIDIMSIGSGNTGATNVWRVLGWKSGALVFVLDVLKGLAPTLIARQTTQTQTVWFAVGVVAVLGHSFSPFLKFKGGKGISTLLGTVIGASPFVAAAGFAVFLLVMVATRYVSLASILAVASAVGFSVLFRDEPTMPWLFWVILLLLLYRHRANIKRLRAGVESKFTLRGQDLKPGPAPSEELPSAEESNQPVVRETATRGGKSSDGP